MEEKQLREAFQSWAENDISPQTIDLWPRVKENLVAKRQNRSKQGVASMSTPPLFNRRLRWAAAISVIVMLFAVFLLVTPPGKAFAQSVLRFFLRSEQNTLTLPTVAANLQSQPAEIAATPLPTGVTVIETEEGCGTAWAPRCSLEEAQAKVDFILQTPSSLPDGMTFTGAADVQSGVWQTFSGADSGSIFLFQSKTEQQTTHTWTIGKDTLVEMVTVGNQPAEYVQGSWIGLDVGEENDMGWNSDIPVRTLRWQADGIQYTLVHYPEQGAHGPFSLDLSQLQAVAESLSTSGANAAATEAQDGLSLQQAEEKAGFAFVEPGWLPPAFTLLKNTYNSQYNTVCQLYRYQASGMDIQLVIVQSNWALPEASEFQAKAFYDGKPIEISIFQEYLPVGGANGDQGLFVDTGLRPNVLCGGEDITSHRVLLWQQGNRTNAIFTTLDANDGRGFVTRREMRRMAETINGVQPEAEFTDTPDPERLLSLKDAEALTGLDLKLPALMLSNVRFDHMADRTIAENPGGPLGTVSAYYAGQPTGDGRTYHVMVLQSPHAQTTLEELALAGGYEPVMVKGNAGIYNAQCWDDPAGGQECHQYLSWFEEDTRFDTETYFPALVPKETILAIAESMR